MLTRRPRGAAPCRASWRGAAVFVVIAGCSSSSDPGVQATASARQTVVYDDRGDATRDVTFTIALTGSDRAHHVALDAVVLPGWDIDAVVFEPSEWPATVEGKDVVRLTVHVTAHANFVSGEAHPIDQPSVDLVGDDGPFNAPAGIVENVETFLPCPQLRVDAIAAQLGLTVLTSAETSPGATVLLDEMAGTDDGAWILGSSGTTGIQRLIRAKDGVGYLPKELAGNRGRLAVGAKGSVVVSVETDGGWDLVRYDGDATKSWSHSLADTASAWTSDSSVAVAGGRVLVWARAVLFDGKALPQAPTDSSWIVLDEVTGEVVTIVGGAGFQGIGLADGGFAGAIDGNVVVLEPDLSPRWTTPILATPLEFAEQSGVLWLISPHAAQPLDVATGAEAGSTLEYSPSGDVAILPDGGVLVATEAGSLARVRPDGTVQEVAFTGVAPWCKPVPKSIARTARSGAAFAMTFTHDDPNQPSYGKPMPTLVGVLGAPGNEP